MGPFNIDVYFQEEKLTCTRHGFPLVPVPTYLPNQYELEQNDICRIENAVYADSREAECEMQVIINEDHHN